MVHWNALGLFYQFPEALLERARGFQMAAEWAPEIPPSRAFLGDGNGLDAPAFRDHQGVPKALRGSDRTAQGHSNEPLHVIGNQKLQLQARRAWFLPSKNEAARMGYPVRAATRAVASPPALHDRLRSGKQSTATKGRRRRRKLGQILRRSAGRRTKIAVRSSR